GEEHQYWVAGWNGKAWEATYVTNAGRQFPRATPDDRRYEPCYSGGIVFDRADPAAVYLSRPVGDVFEIERWWLSSQGINWVHEPVTAGSAMNNVRPCVPEGRADWGPEALWMHGDYVHYADFYTDIRIR
ncbi:MAG: hypothetical protein JXB46_00345, partial [Candidatus Eisenbacteria bacterium]|nr:hypothetical protein [Candidatus Eisenbacteria bacterium]